MFGCLLTRDISKLEGGALNGDNMPLHCWHTNQMVDEDDVEAWSHEWSHSRRHI